MGIFIIFWGIQKKDLDIIFNAIRTEDDRINTKRRKKITKVITLKLITHIDQPNLTGSLILLFTVFIVIFCVFLLMMVSVTVVFDWQGDPESMYTMRSSSHIISNVVKLRHSKHDPKDGRRQTKKKIHIQVNDIFSVFL